MSCQTIEQTLEPYRTRLRGPSPTALCERVDERELSPSARLFESLYVGTVLLCVEVDGSRTRDLEHNESEDECEES